MTPHSGYTLNFEGAQLTPYDHQRLGSTKLVTEPVFALFDEMGAGKTKQVIDAAQIMFLRGMINRVIVVAPAAVRSVWFDMELGELRKHCWSSVKNKVKEYHATIRRWTTHDDDRVGLEWIVTNYEFIRDADRLKFLLQFCNRNTLLVLDESSAVKNHRAQQYRACLQIRRRVGRVVLLNGTPIANNPGDMFAQGNLMDPRIHACPTWTHFRSKYAVMGGFQNRQIVNWINLEDLQQRFAPYVLRRLKTDCLDLPEKLPPVTITVPMKQSTWEIYREMRDDLVAWLDQQTISAAPQAIVKALRLAQLTSGFLGGLQQITPEESQILANRPAWIDSGDTENGEEGLPPEDPITGSHMSITGLRRLNQERVEEVSREKFDAVVEFIKERFAEDPNLKLMFWCRFRPEVRRFLDKMPDLFPDAKIGAIWGEQKDRSEVLRWLDPRTAPPGPVLVFGTPGSGAMGLNCTASHIMSYISRDHNLKNWLQSQDRVHRPGQTKPVSYFDFVACGPQGQKTVDHAILKAVRNKDNLATLTCSAWRRLLLEE